jgi:hypothetical protein
MNDKIFKENVKSILDKQILYSSNPYEEIKMKKISKNIKNRLLEQQTNNSTTITYNNSNLILNVSTIKRDITLPKINSHRDIKPKKIYNQSKFK